MFNTTVLFVFSSVLKSLIVSFLFRIVVVCWQLWIMTRLAKSWELNVQARIANWLHAPGESFLLNTLLTK